MSFILNVYKNLGDIKLQITIHQFRDRVSMLNYKFWVVVLGFGFEYSLLGFFYLLFHVQNMLKNVTFDDILLYFYCISVIPPLGDVIDVFGNVNFIERVNVNTHCKSGQYKLIMCYCTNFISFFSCTLHLWFLYQFGISSVEY